MRTLAEVEDDICTTEWDIEALKDHLQELEDERVRVEDGQPCPDCDGQGEVTCEACDGTGYEDLDVEECNDCLSAGSLECGRCNGEGRIDW